MIFKVLWTITQVKLLYALTNENPDFKSILICTMWFMNDLETFRTRKSMHSSTLSFSFSKKDLRTQSTEKRLSHILFQRRRINWTNEKQLCCQDYDVLGQPALCIFQMKLPRKYHPLPVQLQLTTMNCSTELCNKERCHSTGDIYLSIYIALYQKIKIPVLWCLVDKRN